MVIRFVMKRLSKYGKRFLHQFGGRHKTRPTKQTIPKALREQVWLKYYNETFSNKCLVQWCTNKITPFTYHVGHNIPESRGGETNIRNLIPICAKCNLSMGNRYTINEWCTTFK